MMASHRRTEFNQTPNARAVYTGVSVWVITSIREKKRIQIGCGVVKTARRLAQKQPSFKECVIAH